MLNTKVARTNSPPREFSHLFTMLYAAVLTACIALSNKIVVFHGMLIGGAVFAFPLLYFFGDIIAEVYGYNIARKLIWYSLACAILFSVLVTIVIKLPAPTFDNHQKAFMFVLGGSFKFAIVGIIAMLAGAFSNAYIISKWKILVKGRYFWIRSLVATTVGEFVNTIVVFPLIFCGTLPFIKIANMIIVSFLAKEIYAFFAVAPAAVIVNYLKAIKGIDVFDDKTNFNPFLIQDLKNP